MLPGISHQGLVPGDRAVAAQPAQPWLAGESGDLGCWRSLGWTGEQMWVAGGAVATWEGKGGNPSSEEKTRRQATSRQEEGRGSPAAGDGGAGGGRVGAWRDQTGCRGGRAAFPQGSHLRPGVPPLGRVAVANDAVKEQRGGDGVTYKVDKMQPQISLSPRGG